MLSIIVSPLRAYQSQAALLIFFFFFYFLDYTKYRECIALAQKTDIEILMDIHVLRATESKKVSFGMSSMCLSVCGHDNSKNN